MLDRVKERMKIKWMNAASEVIKDFKMKAGICKFSKHNQFFLGGLQLNIFKQL